ncbi:glycosyl hydrolase family 18 protein [Pedobacter jeongneungensis]|uniref:glycosyl hydrolase family 18 protein n=1 Tax=Pedobacter jeongneungensis TaxID=947309 RepID=UPI00046A40A3|nr:glycosyl hydrolase family 18 protein [Pedobacter jeongneungensis]
MRNATKTWLGTLLALTVLYSCKKSEMNPEQETDLFEGKKKEMAVSSLIAGTSFRVVGYMPSWAGAVNQIQFSKLTHVNYAFVLPNSTGGLQPVENPSKLQSLVSSGHAAGVKVLIAVGGWNNGNDSAFESLAANSTYRTNFTNNMISFVSQYNLDGVDIDWEYPDNGSSANNYTLLMQQLSTALHNNGKLLTAAVVSENGGSIQNAVFTAVDFLNLMAYDGGGANHSTYNYAVNSINYWQGRGLSAAKTTLGVPFYGRSSSSYLDYKDILAQGGSPNSDTFGNIGYNGIPTIKSKTNLAYDRTGGIMIWDLNADATGGNSLLSAINEAIIARVNNGGSSIPYGTVISLKGFNNKYVSGQNGTAAMTCNTTTATSTERFTVIDAGGGKVALRSMGKYVSSENGTQAVTCSRATISDWEKFDWVVAADGKIAFKGNNGKYLSSENGTQAMTCTRATASGWEYFSKN